jgi:hypothetical protein
LRRVLVLATVAWWTSAYGAPSFRVRTMCALARTLRWRPPIAAGVHQTASVVSFLLSVTFACGLVIAVAHVVNRRFIAPVYDVAANLTAFACAVAASSLLGHPIPAILSGVAILCWLVLARRTILDRRQRRIDVTAGRRHAAT